MIKNGERKNVKLQDSKALVSSLWVITSYCQWTFWRPLLP